MAVTVTREVIQAGGQGKDIHKITLAWVSDASGNASATVNLHGFLLKAVTVPDGSAAPTDNYDITLLQNGVDMASGVLGDRSTNTNQVAYGIAKNGTDVAPLPPYLVGDHTFTVANAGNAKAGTCYLYLADCL